MIHALFRSLMSVFLVCSFIQGAYAQFTFDGPPGILYTATPESGGYNVVIQSQPTQTGPVSVSNGALAFTNNASFSLENTADQMVISLMSFGTNGLSTGSGDATSGSNSGYMTATNQGSIYFLSPTGVSLVFGFFSRALAGVGGDADDSDAKYNAGNGGSQAGDVYLSNTSGISIQGQALYGASALEAFGGGGDGGNVPNKGNDHNGNPTYGGGSGGDGGFGGTVTAVNSGGISIGSSNDYIFGEVGARGFSAFSFGGKAGTGAKGANGGSGGAVGLTSSGPVSIYWFWNSSTGTSTGLWGVLASSKGQNGQMSVTSEVNGGSGGAGGPVNVTVSADVVVQSQNTAPTRENPESATGPSANVQGAGILVESLAGTGGAGYDKSQGGTGGSAGYATGYPSGSSVTLNNATVTTGGDGIAGIILQQIAGAGGPGGAQQDHSNGGDGGTASDVTVTINGATASAGVSTNGNIAPGLVVQTAGGKGGHGTDFTNPAGDLFGFGDGGTGGVGGASGEVQISLSGNTSIQTTGTQSGAILAESVGGAGGTGGFYSGFSGDGGAGGAAGAGSDVTISIGSGAVLGTSGESSHGVVGRSSGGLGGTAGTQNTIDNSGSSGGAGGASGDVAITLGSGAAITTSGANSAALVAQSLSGGGGVGGQIVEVLGGTSGVGGAGGATGVVLVENKGAITTSGDSSRGILAQALSGAGGAAGSASGLFYAGGASGSSSGVVGNVTVWSMGTVKTTGSGSHGIELQSIAGGGGAAGSTSLGIVSLGGSSSDPATADGGYVELGQSGSVATSGDGAFGLLLQSIGGGGGDGGSSQSLLVGIGGTGGGGGAGGTVNAGFSGSISTGGDLAHGLVGQSIGGGGGSAGNATSTTIGVAVTVGGSGGDGGAGGTVNMVSNANVTTAGTKSIGIVAQSVGGGGGAGGAAYASATDQGFSTAVAVGGAGGSGGAGGKVTLAQVGGSIFAGNSPMFANLTTPTNQLPVDCYGIVAQSIGGGGGVGGAASAQALAIAYPDPEAPSLAAAISVGVGGSGGNGGDSEERTLVTLSRGASVTTQGQGSHAIVVQSVGGGGGLGGDSSASSTTIAYGRAATATGQNPWTTDISVSVGGSGGGSGDGNSAEIYLGGTQSKADPQSAKPVNVVTYGDYANGVQVQSIGGGGGNAGFGSTTTQDFGSTRNFHVGVGVGGTGGAGGAGGEVLATLYSGAQVVTYGSGANGLVAQSIGGGGGASQGGSINLGAAYSFSQNGVYGSVTPAANLEIGIGSTGAKGGNGGEVNITIEGSITTHGGDAVGVLAQSIGGGGGLGGSAGSDASADNPITIYSEGVREFISELGELNAPFTGTLSLSFGGTGGTAAAGGEVNVTHSGSISTLGDWSHGIVAQSVGGGGGKGGTAFATGTGAIPQLTLNVVAAVGGGGGTGGDGADVNIALDNGSIATGGYGAFGILAQSIGGGGGLGADGSDAATGSISVGGTGSGDGGGAGDGSEVTLSGSGTIVTSGEGAHGVVLQSIGGGGGVGGAGSSLFGGAGPAGGSIQVSVGGGNGASGYGNAVQIENAVLQIQTSGTNAFGILAQSIGGGGGLGATQQGIETSTALGGAGEYSMGGTVTIDLDEGSKITTSGDGAHAIVAQSIGGGGGIAGYPTGAPTISVTPPSRNVASGTGNSVTLDVDADISTSGAGAFGILAQSIGAGGGMQADGGTLYLGSTAAAGSYGVGSGVSISQAGSINTPGENSVGIFGQSTNGGVFVEVQGSVFGGSGDQGAGIWISTTNVGSIIIDDGGTVGAVSGVAITNGGLGGINVTNSGAVTGSYYLGSGTLTNEGTVNAGDVAEAKLTVNSGIFSVGEASGNSRGKTPARKSPFGRTTVIGDFEQTEEGELRLDVDFSSRRSDQLHVKGDTKLSGIVRVSSSDSLPFAQVPFLVADGKLWFDAEVELATGPSALFHYALSQHRNTLRIGATSANFSPRGAALGRNGDSVAEHLGSIWAAGGNSAFDDLFLSLDRVAGADLGAYTNQINQLGPGASLGFAARRTSDMQAFGETVVRSPGLEEISGAWAITRGQTAALGGDGFTDFRINSSVTQVGGQTELNDGWFLGGSLAYEHSWLNNDQGNISGDGDAFLGAITLKRVEGPWRFAAAVYGSVGFYDTDRSLSVPGVSANANGSPDVQTAGFLLQAAFLHGDERFYLRPSLTLNTVYVHADSYTESGAGFLDLAVDSGDLTTFIATPAIEIGGTFDLRDSVRLRPFLLAGIDFLTSDDWEQNSRLAGAPAGAAPFRTTIPMDNVVGRISAGVEYKANERLGFAIQYEGEYSNSIIANGGSIRASLAF